MARSRFQFLRWSQRLPSLRLGPSSSPEESEAAGRGRPRAGHATPNPFGIACHDCGAVRGYRGVRVAARSQVCDRRTSSPPQLGGPHFSVSAAVFHRVRLPQRRAIPPQGAEEVPKSRSSLCIRKRQSRFPGWGRGDVGALQQIVRHGGRRRQGSAGHVYRRGPGGPRDRGRLLHCTARGPARAEGMDGGSRGRWAGSQANVYQPRCLPCFRLRSAQGGP